jgi:hypothetical protein
MALVVASLGLVSPLGPQSAAEAGVAKFRNLGNGPIAINVALVAENSDYVLSHGWVIVPPNQEVEIPFTYDKCFVLVQRENDKFVHMPNREKRPYPIYHQGHRIKLHPLDKSVTIFEMDDKPGMPVNTKIGGVPPGWKLVDHYAVSDKEVVPFGP